MGRHFGLHPHVESALRTCDTSWWLVTLLWAILSARVSSSLPFDWPCPSCRRPATSCPAALQSENFLVESSAR